VHGKAQLFGAFEPPVFDLRQEGREGLPHALLAPLEWSREQALREGMAAERSFWS
jgi:hypothetical protein